MKTVFCYLVLLLGVFRPHDHLLAREQGIIQDSFTVYLFLLEDCRITQAYTDDLEGLYRKYSNDSIAFQGCFPNPISQDSTLAAFVKKYGLSFPCRIEGTYSLAKMLGVTVTPEVVVYNHSRMEVVYQGRISNLFEHIGKRRRVVTSLELRDALEAIIAHKPVPVPRTIAVGCLLN